MMQDLPRSVDVAIIGAGPAGCSAAMAPARAGLSVLLIEREPASRVGDKICGNALTAEGVAAMSDFIAPPAGPEVVARIMSGTFYAPDGTTGARLPMPGVVLNRLTFGQRLLADAVEAGAELADECSCVGWSDRNELRVRVRSDGGESEICARIFIDASGYRSVLARDGGPIVADVPTRDEVGVAYREIVSLRAPIDENGGAYLVLSPPGAEFGYAWVFPMGGRLVNVGIGASLSSVEGSLKSAYDAFVASRPELRGAEAISSGAGMVPLRRPLASLVGDGFMAVGDAGCLAHPLSGGGIAAGVIAGGMAGEQAVEALSNGASSVDALWGYGKRFMTAVGASYAGHEVLKGFVFSMSHDELMFLWREMAKPQPLERALREGRLLSGAGGAIKLLAAFTTRPGLATRIIRESRAVAAVRRHYQDYPDSPSGLAQWVARGKVLRRTRGMEN
jgi:digeranylgeranylglycerophospholipid reductase